MATGPTAASARTAPRRRRLWDRYASLVLRLRWAIVAFWLAVTVGATLLLPGIGSGAGGIKGLIPEDNPAVTAELRSYQEFGFPLYSRVVLVQRDPHGLSPYTQAEAVLRALAVDQGSYDAPGVLGALPLPNTLGLIPGASERDTTVLTYLFTPPTWSFAHQQSVAQQFAEKHLSDPDDHYVGITGSIPARGRQASLITGSLPLVELTTVLAIAVIVALNFRSVVAPLLTLATAGVAAVVTLRIVGFVGRLLGISIPGELEPLLIALILGVVTDYAVFFLSGMRPQLALGRSGAASAHSATRSYGPIITAAGLTVAAGTAALLAARSPFFRSFGPGMALTVLVGLTVSVTLIPALMALLGPRAFWPSHPVKGQGGPASSETPLAARPPSRVTAALTRRPIAAVVAVLTVAGLTFVALPLRGIELGLSFVNSLPSDDPVARAAVAARTGFSPGILAPTELLLEHDGVASDRAALNRLEDLLEQQPGLAAVIGPRDLPVPAEFNVFTAKSGNAARMLIVLDSTPLGAQGIATVNQLSRRLPALVDQAGLAGVRASLAGDTAVAATIVQSTTDDLIRIAVAALLVNLILLMLFLRALVAPLYLLASSVLALCGALGLTVSVFQNWLGRDGLTFYVPFAAAVLLVSLGSDYNIFAVGHVWAEARRRPLAEAVRVAMPQSTRAIAAAGIALAASFGFLSVVPLQPFQELAFAMVVGILLDSIVVRSLLVPSLLVLVGPVSGWPAAHLQRRAPAEPETGVEPAPTG